MRIPIPRYVRSLIFKQFGIRYGVKFEDIEDELESFDTFNKFFTRTVKERQFPKTEETLIAPADSKIISLSKITGNDVVLAKKVNYSLGHFLTGEFGKNYSHSDVQNLKSNPESDLYSIVFYLAPGDYHRYHSMAHSVLIDRVHVAGELFTVKDTFVSRFSGVYEVNERVVLNASWKYGFLSQVYVAATNVGTMSLNVDPDLNTNQAFSSGPIISRKSLSGIKLNVGQEVGRFNMGSTVVAVVEVPKNFVFNVKVGDRVRFGDVIGSLQ